jgi:hypothetical protein
MAEAGSADRYAEAVWSSLDQTRLRREEETRQERARQDRALDRIITREKTATTTNQEQEKSNTRKLAAIAAQLKKEEGQDVFSIKRKVNW